MHNLLLYWKGTGREIKAPVLIFSILVCGTSFGMKAEMRFLVPAFVNCLGQAFNTFIWTEDARRPFPVICDFTSLPKVLTIRQQSPSFSFNIILKTPVMRCSDSSGLATRWWVHRTFCCVHCGYSI